MNFLNLNSFLEFGYFLKYENAKPPIDVSLATPEKYKDVPYDEILKIGLKLYREAVDSLFEPRQDNCVPLSGGVDSRMVLAGLMECTEVNNIHTYTFGVPGALDYEIGQKIAKKIGTKHTQINLDDCVYTQDELLEISRRMDMQAIVFLTPPLSVLDQFKNMNIWSGYLGDTVLAVTYLHEDFPFFNEELARHFLQRQKLVKSINLTDGLNTEYLSLLDGWNKKSHLSPGDILEIEDRMTKNTYPNVCIKGFDYKIPALDHELAYFAISIDESHKIGSKYRLDITKAINPAIVHLPLGNKFGLSGNASKFAVMAKRYFRYVKKRAGFKSMTGFNYQDFDKNIIEKQYLKRLIRDCIGDLEDRNIIPWIKPSKIFEDHLAGRGKHGDALIVLTSLEIHLKNGKIP